MKDFNDEYDDIYSGRKDRDFYEDVYSGKSDDAYEDVFSGKTDSGYDDYEDYSSDLGSDNPYAKETDRRQYVPQEQRGYRSPYNPPERDGKNGGSRKNDSRHNSRRKKKNGKKKFLTLLIILLILILGAAVYLTYNIISKVNYVPSEHSNLYMDTDNLMSDRKVKNILFIGVDDDSGGSSRSDSMILVSLDENNKKIKLTSFMRDTWVYIPDHDYAKLNAAYSYGGTGLLMDTIEYNFGIQIDNYCLVDFEIFSDIIDELGGVTVEVEKREADFINRTSKQNIESGKTKLNGAEALVYCRIRYLDSDFYRTARQRKVMNAIVTQAKDSNVFTLYSLAETILPQVKTDITKAEMTLLVIKAMRYIGYDMQEMRIPVDNTYTNKYFGSQEALSIDFEANKKALKEFIYN